MTGCSKTVVLGDTATIAPTCNDAFLVYRNDSQPSAPQPGIGQEITALETWDIGRHVHQNATFRFYRNASSYRPNISCVFFIFVILPVSPLYGIPVNFVLTSFTVPSIITGSKDNRRAAIHCQLPSTYRITAEYLTVHLHTLSGIRTQEKVWKPEVISISISTVSGVMFIIKPAPAPAVVDNKRIFRSHKINRLCYKTVPVSKVPATEIAETVPVIWSVEVSEQRYRNNFGLRRDANSAYTVIAGTYDAGNVSAV